jgi:hypothetical protein
VRRTLHGLFAYEELMAWTDGVVIFLVLLLIAVFPAWPHSRNWGYFPSAGVSAFLLILLIVLVARTV